MLGTTMRSDGTEQVTYAGHPLYTFVEDKKPGEANGNEVTAFGAQWYALKGNGEEAGDLGALAVGDRGRDELADLGQEPGRQLARLLLRTRLAPGRVEEADPEPRPAGKAGQVRGPLDRHQADVGLRHLEGQAADAAAGAQHLPARAGPFGEDADAGAGPQRLDRLRQRLGVAGAALDRDLTHPVEDRGQPAHIPERRFGERADLAARRAAIPTISGSQWLSWLPTTSNGPLSGSESSPSTRSLPHQATGRLSAIAKP